MGATFSKIFDFIETAGLDSAPSPNTDQGDVMAAKRDTLYDFEDVFQRKTEQLKELWKSVQKDYLLANQLRDECESLRGQADLQRDYQSLWETKQLMERNIDELTSKKQLLQSEVLHLEKRKENLEAIISELVPKAQAHQRLYRRRSQGDTMPSESVTHDDVAQVYSTYFKNAERKLQRKIGKTAGFSEETFSFLPKQAFELSYEKFQVMIQEAFKKKIESLYCFPDDPLKIPDVGESTRNLWRAYELLLQCTPFEKDEFVDAVVVEISRHFCAGENAAFPVITEEVAKACRLAWDIGTLIPPAVIGCPTDYNKDLHDCRFQLQNPPYTLCYYRPVLLHGSHGQIAEKGLVSSKSLADSKTRKFVANPKPTESTIPAPAGRGASSDTRKDVSSSTRREVSINTWRSQQQKWKCRACSEQILERDAVVVIQGSAFHRHHSYCNMCQKPLEDFSYLFDNGRKTVICSTCQVLAKIPKSQGASSMDKQNICTECFREISGRNLKYAMHYDIVGCKHCFDKIMQCKGCHEEFTPQDEKICYYGNQWHRRCRVCHSCGEVINGHVYTKLGKPTCNDCFHRR